MFPTFETSYSGIVSVGNSALSWYANYAIGLSGNENTAVNVGNVVTGNAYYVYQDQNGAQSIIPTTYDFRSNLTSGHTLFGGVVTATTALKDPVTGTTPPSVSTSHSGGRLTYINFGGGSYYSINLDIPNAPDTVSSCEVYFYDSQFSLPESYSTNGLVYVYGVERASTTARLRGVRDGTNNGIGFTTVSSIHNNNIYVPYAPISNTNATYNDVKGYIVDWANDLSTDLDLGFVFADADFYDFDVAIETESESEIETDSELGGCCNIDYNEILSEGELESILTQETYYIPEITTEIVTEDYTIMLPETESDTDTLEVVQAVSTSPALVSHALSLLDSWGISGMFISLTTIYTIWHKILR